MKKYILLILFVGVMTVLAEAQDSTWIKEYVFDAPQYHYDMIEAYDHGFVFTGTQLKSFEYPAVDFAFILKVDVNGNVLWKKLVGYLDPNLITNVTAGRRIIQTSDGGLVLAGNTAGVALKSWDVYVVKLNACGEKEWSRIFRNDSDGQMVGGVRETSDGSFLLSLDAWEDWNHTGKEWVIKLSSEGETIWMKSYGDWDGNNHHYCGNTEAHYMLPASNQRFVTLGETYKVELPDTTVFYERPMFVEIDTAGNEIWHNVYTDNIYVGSTYKGVIDSSDNLYAGGFTAYSTVLNYPGEQPVLYKLDSTGNMLWFKVVGDTNAIVGAISPVSIMDDTIIFSGTGYRYRTSGEDSVRSYLIKLDSGGREIKRRLIACNAYGEADDASRCSLVTYNKKYLVSFQHHNPIYFEVRKYNKELEYDSIYTAVFMYDSLCPYPIKSDTINIDTIIINISEKMQKLGDMSVYPNPASSRVRVEINKVKHVVRELRVVTITGQTVYSAKIAPGQANATVDVNGWNEGLYLFILYEHGLPVETEKVLVTP